MFVRPIARPTSTSAVHLVKYVVELIAFADLIVDVPLPVVGHRQQLDREEDRGDADRVRGERTLATVHAHLTERPGFEAGNLR